MADGMKLKVVTPTGGFYDGEVSMVELTTTEGEIGIYPNHIPLTAVVAPGVLKIHEDGGEKEAALMSVRSAALQAMKLIWMQRVRKQR